MLDVAFGLLLKQPFVLPGALILIEFEKLLHWALILTVANNRMVTNIKLCLNVCVIAG